MASYLRIKLIAIAFIISTSGCKEEKKVEIAESPEGWELLVEGKPFYIQGIVGHRYFREAAHAGANAVRTGSSEELLDSAHEYGLLALVNLPLYGERDGMDWNNDSLVRQQAEKVLERVRKLKDHPAVFCWSLGNELDWIPPGKPYHPRLWIIIDSIAGEIKRVDPAHPVLTVVGDSHSEEKIREINRDCPNLDLLGINAYGALEKMAGLCNAHLDKPYLVTEWGVTGYWEQPGTLWGAAVEENTSEKAARYEERYRNAILENTGRCLGSFVFYWDWKQEITHTWFGMFDREGLANESVDVMHRFWTGEWPENRAPSISTIRIGGQQYGHGFVARPGERFTADISGTDPDGDELEYAWEIKKEVTPGTYAGHGEVPATPLPGLIEDSTRQTISFLLPDQPGAYRIFAYLKDGSGHVASANTPFYAGDPGITDAP